MSTPQPGILLPVPSQARYLEFRIIPDSKPASVLRQFASQPIDQEMVFGIGPRVVQGLDHIVDGLRPFPSLSQADINVPSTQADLWCWVRGSDRGRIAHAARAVSHALDGAFVRDGLVDGFMYDGGRDLTGYEDGTENPVDDDAIEAAIAAGAGPGLDGSSFVAVQQWLHDLDMFDAMSQDQRDDSIGRRQSDNEEFAEAPASAHVKRTAQESFDPEAFVVRRSMPWADAGGEGLMFVAFGKSFDAFEAQLRRMIGQDDDIIDGLFQFSSPKSGSYFWCPPVANGCLDLSAIGL